MSLAVAIMIIQLRSPDNLGLASDFEFALMMSVLLIAMRARAYTHVGPRHFDIICVSGTNTVGGRNGVFSRTIVFHRNKRAT